MGALRMSWMLCLNTSTIRPAGLMEKIEAAARAGYGGIELWSDDLTAFERSGGSLKTIRRALEENGLHVPSVIALTGWIDAAGAWQQAFDEARRRMEQAAAVGARSIVASPPQGRVDLRAAADRYRALLAAGREIGVTPSMEFLGFTDHVNDIETAWEIVERAGEPDGAIVVDPFHIFRGGGSFESVSRIPAGRISIVHFNDAPASPAREKQTDADRVMPGDGVLPLADFARRLREGGYGGPVSLELFHPGLWRQDPFETARLGLEKMRAALALA